MGVDCGIVGFEFYETGYKGNEVENTSFPALCARAVDIIGAVTHWAVNAENLSNLPPLHQMLYKKAVCAQIDFLAINGTDSINETGNGGFTVGKVTVHGKASANGGRMSESISPMAISYLEQTGLMNPQIPTIEGWW